jgi:hypothetical protein
MLNGNETLAVTIISVVDLQLLTLNLLEIAFSCMTVP